VGIQHATYSATEGYFEFDDFTLESKIIKDSFDDPHNYLTEGVAGTIWDGFVGMDDGETVSQLNASQTTPGALYISSVDSWWEPDWDPLGPFLYRNVKGDFTATVRVLNASSGQWNCAGLAARVPDDIDGGAGEDFEAIDYFQAISQHIARTVDNGIETEFALASPLAQYLRLRRVGNLFYHEYSYDGFTWRIMGDSPKRRDDMEGQTLQVGIQHATYSATEGYFEFDDFTLDIDPHYEARLGSPADEQEDVLLDTSLTWIPGDSTAETGGHDLYIGLDYDDVMNATRTSHPNVDYHNLNLNSFTPGTLLAGTMYYWRVDEVNLPDIWASQVWSFTTQDSQAGVLSPIDGAIGIDMQALLTWQNGVGADRHDIYFGDDFNAVFNAQKYAGDIDCDRDVDFDDLAIMSDQWIDGPCLQITCADVYFDGDINFKDFCLLAQDWLGLGNDLYRGSTSVSETYSPGLLDPLQTYYWRVDEYDYYGAGFTKGDVWSFTTEPEIKNIEIVELTNGTNTFQSHNQKVVSNENGIFLTYVSTTSHRLSRSTDGGQTFSTVYDITTNASPAIETDEDNNIYLSFPVPGGTRFLRFTAANNYSAPDVDQTYPGPSSGSKFAMAYDQLRQQFYHATQFGWILTIDKAGNLLRSQQVWANGATSTSYPHLFVDPNGVLHHAFTMADSHDWVPYEMIRYIRSTDGGASWQRMDGTTLSIPTYSGLSGDSTLITWTDGESSVYSTWLANMYPKNGKIHFFYTTGWPWNPVELGNPRPIDWRVHYVRFNEQTGEREVDSVTDWYNSWHGKTINLSLVSGVFVSDPQDPSEPLYAVSYDTNTNCLAALISLDNGSTWQDYARSSMPMGHYAVGGCRVVTSDGKVIGSFTGNPGDDWHAYYFEFLAY